MGCESWSAKNDSNQKHRLAHDIASLMYELFLAHITNVIVSLYVNVNFYQLKTRMENINFLIFDYTNLS